jgi:membrane fusion protein, multidrug efflux system
MNKTLKRVLLYLAVGLVLFLLALPKLGWLNSKSEGPQPGAAQGPPAIPVNGMVVKREALDNKIVVTGSVTANESLELKSEVSGKITRIYFSEGQRVRKGQLLVQINDEELRAQQEKLKYSKKLYEESEFRQRTLLEREAISQEEYDNALTLVNTIMADIRVIDAQLAKSRIVAPFDGVIGLRLVSEGAYITPANVIANLYNLNPAKIEFSIPSKYSTKVKTGNKIIFTIEADARKYEGVVYAVEPNIDVNTRTLSLKATCDNRDGSLLPGQFVKIDLVLESMPDAIMVPSEAVIPELNGYRVFVYRGGMASSLVVEAGIRTEKELEITRGLQTGDTLITTGIMQIRDGVKVEIKNLNN